MDRKCSRKLEGVVDWGGGGGGGGGGYTEGRGRDVSPVVALPCVPHLVQTPNHFEITNMSLVDQNMFNLMQSKSVFMLPVQHHIIIQT